jgi:hypothetical protein
MPKASLAPAQKSLRPGIKDSTLERLKIRRVTADEAHALTGARQSGIYIPFHIDCVGGPYGRLRLDKPLGDKKYHQRLGSEVHNYIQEGITLKDGKLILVEGEFKAISLTEAGFPAVGTSGFYSWGQRKSKRSRLYVLHPEIKKLIKTLKPKQVVFVGDPDTALNAGFADAMKKFTSLKPCPCPLAILRIPYDAPHGKGVDDIRESMGEEAFAQWFQKALDAATVIPPEWSREEIMKSLIEREMDLFPGLKGSVREKAIDQLPKLYIWFRNDQSKAGKEVKTMAKTLATETYGMTNEEFDEKVMYAVMKRNEELQGPAKKKANKRVEDRPIIYRMRKAGKSQREIAHFLGFSQSTISKERSRNRRGTGRCARRRVRRASGYGSFLCCRVSADGSTGGSRPPFRR